jgi:AcrR family transcriptional regulator
MKRQTAPERRQTLLQAALDLFSAQGYDGTTTRAVAERAGVTEALLFKHFHTKQELLSAVVEEFGPQRIFSPPPALVHDLPARPALEQAITRYLDTFWENRPFMRMVFTTPKRDQHVYGALWAEFSRQALYLYTLMQELEDRGEVRNGVATAMTDVVSAATSGFLQRSLSEEPPDWPAARTQFVAHLLEVTLNGIVSENR